MQEGKRLVQFAKLKVKPDTQLKIIPFWIISGGGFISLPFWQPAEIVLPACPSLSMLIKHELKIWQLVRPSCISASLCFDRVR